LLIGSIGGSNEARAEDSVSISRGQPAPFSGILFTDEKAADIRNDLLEGDKNKLLLETEKHRTERLLTIGKMKDEEIELYRTQNQRLLKTNDRSDTVNMLWFGLGIVVTGMAVYGAGSLAR
jgi:hypothetical protein